LIIIMMRLFGNGLIVFTRKSSERYSARPMEELFGTASNVAEAKYAMLVHDDFSKIDSIIEIISKLRLRGGFGLSEVQNAFELYRTILLPILFKELDRPLLYNSVQKLNTCLSYAIHKFSDNFQALHENGIRCHAETLEKEVKKRTGQLIASEAKYRMLVEEINDGHFINQKGCIAFANKEFCDMHGYSSEEIIGKHFLDFVAPESLTEVRRNYEERMTTERQRSSMCTFDCARMGTHRYTENKVRAVIFQNEIAAAVLQGYHREDGDGKTRLRMVELENENKRVAVETLHQLMVTLSHYLLNADTIIGGMVRRCERLDSKEEIHSSLQVIEEQARKIEISSRRLNDCQGQDRCLYGG